MSVSIWWQNFHFKVEYPFNTNYTIVRAELLLHLSNLEKVLIWNSTMEKEGRSWAWNSRAEKWPHSGPAYRAVHRWALFISWASAKRHPCIESGRTPLSSSFPTVHFLWKQERRWAQEGFGCVCHFYDMYVECNVFNFNFSRTHHHRTII